MGDKHHAITGKFVSRSVRNIHIMAEKLLSGNQARFWPYISSKTSCNKLNMLLLQ